MGGFKKNPSTIVDLLQHRQIKGSLRSLITSYPSIDFSSNDYLGFSSKGLLAEELKTMNASVQVGSTGSRLISGNSLLFQEIENSVAKFHETEGALIFNSGYDANLGLLSSVPQKGDLILSDELIHASLIDGIRLSFATHYKFRHNDINSLKELISRHRDSFNEVYVVVESVYSMDGDHAPLIELASICRDGKVHLIVDEAHAIGVFGKEGRGLCQELNIHDDCFARIYTYGKAMGCHGATIVGSEELKNYLINFSRSFIYTTAMPEHSLLAIKAAYQLLIKTPEIKKLKANIHYFTSIIDSSLDFIESRSAIHCKLIPGNREVQQLEEKCATEDVFIKSIKSPTVKEGKERLRICLHSFNTEQEMGFLFKLLN
ncbi:MAG: 8-amino-7-oxononanoate synthase [Bacteroidetes bacterium]|jgi:8-amino-7-oxononanoate synthase|nr:8-amino-7-oxononanoate synthase [Bacteroidota bacterium]MDF2451371.1 8-amino-7-oxononanoate synthase [Bacteroidota bacterium]